MSGFDSTQSQNVGGSATPPTVLFDGHMETDNATQSFSLSGPTSVLASAYQPQIYPEHFFWSMEMTWALNNGRTVHGINSMLAQQYPELQEQMVQFLQMVEAQPDASTATGDVFNFDVDMVESHNTSRADSVTTDPDALIGGANVTCPAPNTRAPVSERKASTPIKREPLLPPSPARQRLPSVDAPEYVSDFVDADDARMYLAHPDIEDCQPLHIPNDDFATVQATQQHHFAKLFLEAIVTPGMMSPPALQYGEKDKALMKFRSQQETTMPKIMSEVRTAAQQKQARANCLLAVDAAIFVSKHGIPKQLYNAALTNSSNIKAKRKAHADLRSTCSERLEAMISIVRDYKLVAFDVLTGKNLHRFTYDAQYYAEEKIFYLLSNVQRQENAEAIQAEKPGLGLRTAKRKHEAGDDGEVKDFKRLRS